MFDRLRWRDSNPGLDVEDIAGFFIAWNGEDDAIEAEEEDEAA